MTIQEMIEKVPDLSIEERQQLMHVLVDSIAETNEAKKHSILELEGLGAEIWEEKSRSILEFGGIATELYDGTDAQEYVNQIRSEWDHRP